jgi:hypothetical protein
MNSNQTNLSIPNEQILLINILNNIYNDNLRQIQNLTSSNNEIRNVITNILNNRNTRYNTNNNRNRYRNNYNNTSNTYSSPIYNTSTNTSTNTNTNRFDYSVQPFNNISEYYIPLSGLNSLNTTNTTLPSNDQNIVTRILQRFLDPVPVTPSETQLNNAIRSVRYSDIITPINRSCPISLENFNDNDYVSVIRFCGHIFKTEQLNTWFRSNCRCPVCRYDIRNYNRNSENNDSSSFPTSVDASLNSFETNEERNEIPNNTTNNDLFGSTSNLVNSMFDLMTNDIITDTSVNNINNTRLRENGRRLFNDVTSNFFYDSSGNLTDDSRDSVILLRLINILGNRI